MTYSIDYRKRAVNLIKEGKSKKEVARLFKISRTTLYSWVSKGKNLKPKVHGKRQRKLDWNALKEHTRKYPDALLRERAKHFSVHVNSIWNALKSMGISYKKNSEISGKKSWQED